MEEILNHIKVFFVEIPEYIYLIIGIVFLVLFIGVLKNKNWAIDPASANQRLFYQWFGRKLFKIVIGFVFLLGSASGFFGYYLYAWVLKTDEYNNTINSIENIESKGTCKGIALTFLKIN